MTPDEMILRCHALAQSADDAGSDADSLIGFFQCFRPDGAALERLFDPLDQADSLQRRLRHLYLAAGQDRRPQGGRDAYFIVRRPSSLDPDRAHQLAQSWIAGVRQIAIAVADQEVAEMLAPPPTVRVLEGIPPKHPKLESDKSHLLDTLLTKAPAMVERIEAGPIAPVLRPAYYFTACDAMLRDYLMWPFYVASTGLTDPLAAYFELWKHGIKYRVFNESQVDLYLPRHAE